MLSKHHGQDSLQGILTNMVHWYHKYQHELCIIKTSSIVGLMIAFVSNDSACQGCVIALYHYVFWFCISSSTQYFLTTVMLSMLMFLGFCLPPSNEHLVPGCWFVVFLSADTVFAVCSCSHLFGWKYFLSANLFISYLQLPTHLERNSQSSDIQQKHSRLGNVGLFGLFWVLNYHLLTFVFPPHKHVWVHLCVQLLRSEKGK